MARGEGRASLRAEVIAPGKTLVASARNFTKDPLPTTGSRTQIKTEDWMRLAWLFHDVIPEFHYAVGWVGNLLSRAKLYVTKDGKPTTDTNAVELLDSLFGGPEGQSEMLRQLGIHFTVCGDAYLIGIETDGIDDWLVAAASELKTKSTGDGWTLDGEDIPPDALVIRLWRPHPQKRRFADAPTRAVLPVLSEIDALTKHVAASLDSRLAGAGLLLIPEEMSFASVQQSGDGTDSPNPQAALDEFVRNLMTVMSTALEDRQSPEAIVPLVLQAPGQFLGQIKHLTFWSELDAASKDLRSEAVTRLALGMDMPPEVLTGTADMNHWSAWQMEEAGVKAHTEPLLHVICDALTDGYLRPMLDLAPEEADRYSIVADTSELRLRPNRSKEAFELWDRGAITIETLLRENGFDVVNDLIDPEELKIWLLRKVSQGQTTPDVVLAALRALGVPGLDVIPNEPTQIRENIAIKGDLAPGQEDTNIQAAPDDSTTQARPVPSLKGHPDTSPPEQSAALLAASGVLVRRALERAGNKMKSQMGGAIPGVAAREMYRHVHLDYARVSMDNLLDDAWSFVADIAEEQHVDAGWLTDRLDSYTRDLLRNRKTHSANALAIHLALS